MKHKPYIPLVYHVEGGKTYTLPRCKVRPADCIRKVTDYIRKVTDYISKVADCISIVANCISIVTVCLMYKHTVYFQTYNEAPVGIRLANTHAGTISPPLHPVPGKARPPDWVVTQDTQHKPSRLRLT